MHGRNSTLLLIAYFAGLAILIGGLSGLGIKVNEETILVGMVAVTIVFGLAWLLIKLVKKLIRKTGYSMKQFTAVMTGVDAEIVDAIPGRALVVQPYTTSVEVYEGYDDEDWSTNIEPDGLPLSDTFQPSIHDLLGQMVSVFGLRRQGKSNCVTLLIEGMSPYGLPMLICDTKDEFAGLVNPKYMPHGYMAGAPGATANVPNDVRRYYIAVDEDGAYGFGKAIMEGHMQVVLNLKSYSTDDEAARVMCGIVRGINAWQEERANKDRVPVEVVLSEGHKWLPQNESSEVSKDTQALLHKTFFSTIVRLGGFNGFGFIVDSQRISELDKRCLQSLWKFLFKQTETIDIKKYEECGLTREAILSLKQGECFVYSPKVLGFRTQMYRKKSPDLSMTPTLDRLNQYRPTAQARHQMLAYRKSYTRNQVNEIGLEVPPASAVEEDMVVDADPEPENRLTAEQEAVLGQWHSGRKTHRQIAPALKISEDRALKVLNQLEAMGYIELPHRK